MKRFSHLRLLPGYAETSTKRRPVSPETVMVGESECSVARCVGSVMINGRADWLAFKIPGKRRYYFQLRPW